MWEDLSFKDRSKLIELGASQGILDLSTIKHLYNINADGGYLKWKKEIEKHKGINIDNDNTYNYQAFFEEDPQRAWDMLKKDSKAHFTDKYKTVWHPTFSDESVYSGHKSKYNPQGLVGGHWEGNTFKMSDSLYNSPVSMDERKQYLIDNEPNGASLLESNGTLPVFDGIPWGGVLPEVIVTPQYSDGGSIHIAKNKRGTFKAQASRMGMSTQQAASHILANKDNYSPAMVKKAVFAHNFAHADGGPLDNTFPEDIDNQNIFGNGGAKMTKDRRYRHVTEIYQSFIDNGATPQAALDLTNQKIAEQGWTGYVSGDKVRYDNADDFTQHVIDHYKRMYPDSLKANNFNQFFRGIESTSKYKYNPNPESYRKKLELTRPGVKRRINSYRNEQGLHPLALLTPDTEIPDISDASEPLGQSSFYGAYGGSLESNEDNLLEPIIKYYEDTIPSLAFEDQNTFSKGGQMKKARQAVDYFINKGLTREQAAGLVGNLMRESNMNITATNPNSGAYGIGQWLGNRKTRLFRRYGYHPTFEQQLDYVWDELNTSHRKGLQMLKASKTVNDAARNAFGYYEFSAGPEAAVRAMNSSGKNTKWKNPNGAYALNSGIKNAQMIFEEVPVTVNNAGDTLPLDMPKSVPSTPSIQPTTQPIISDDYIPVTTANLKELPTFGQEEDNDSSIPSFGPQYLAQNLDKLGIANPLNPFEKGYQLQSPKAIYANMQGLI